MLTSEPPFDGQENSAQQTENQDLREPSRHGSKTEGKGKTHVAWFKY